MGEIFLGKEDLDDGAKRLLRSFFWEQKKIPFFVVGLFSLVWLGLPLYVLATSGNYSGIGDWSLCAFPLLFIAFALTGGFSSIKNYSKMEISGTSDETTLELTGRGMKKTIISAKPKGEMLNTKKECCIEYVDSGTSVVLAISELSARDVIVNHRSRGRATHSISTIVMARSEAGRLGSYVKANGMNIAIIGDI